MTDLHVDLALAALHEGYPQDQEEEPPRIVLHTYLGFIGADWDRDEAVKALQDHPDAIRMAAPGTFAWATGHRIYIDRYTKRGSPLFLETREGAFDEVPA